MSLEQGSRWVKCISTHGAIRGIAIQATELIQSMAERHQVSGAGARGLGEAVMGALLISSYCKQNQRINLNIRGSGKFSQALVDAYPDGTVRGYVIERKKPKKRDAGLGPWGDGLLSVLRTRGDQEGQPYIGTVPLVTGHLAKDLSFYWVQSEQIPSAVGLAVNLTGDKITSAGGFLIQAMPGAAPSEIKTIEEHIHEIHSLAERLAEGITPIHLLSQIFQSTAFMVVEERPLQFKCDCSEERVRRALLLSGKEELQSMLDEDHSAQVRCDFCAKEYRFDSDQLRELIDRSK